MEKPKHEKYRSLVSVVVGSCGYRRVLELGCCKFWNAGLVMRENPGIEMVCVDVKPRGEGPEGVRVVLSTTDAYLAGCEEEFDLVFVDACHEAEHVYRDIVGALRVLAPGGTVLVHDVDPSSREWATRQYCWDGYKILGRLEGVDVVVLPVESDGMALIRKRGDTRVAKWAALE